MVHLLIERGWMPWGKPRRRPRNGSVYQCYRRGNEYAWLGSWFVERSSELVAHDYQTGSEIATLRFID